MKKKNYGVEVASVFGQIQYFSALCTRTELTGIEKREKNCFLTGTFLVTVNT